MNSSKQVIFSIVVLAVLAIAISGSLTLFVLAYPEVMQFLFGEVATTPAP